MTYADAIGAGGVGRRCILTSEGWVRVDTFYADQHQAHVTRMETRYS